MSTETIKAWIEERKRLREAASKSSDWVPCIRRHTHGNLGITSDKWHASGPDRCEKKARSDAEWMQDSALSQEKFERVCLALLEAVEKMAVDKDDGGAEGYYGTCASQALARAAEILK